MITVMMGRLTMPLAWRMAVPTSWKHTKMEAMPRMDRMGPAMPVSTLPRAMTSMMGPPRAMRPKPQGRAMRAAMRMADSVMRWAPRPSRRARQAEMPGTMQAVRGIIRLKGRL